MGSFKKLVAMTAVSCMALTTLAGCGDGGSGGGDENTIRIGMNFELTGNVANYGTTEYNGAKLAIKQANENSEHKFKYEIVEGDNKSAAEEATALATKLATSDGVDGMVGPATSGNSLATYQVANDSKVLVVSPSATANGATMNNGKVYDYVYRVCFEDNTQGAAMGVFAYDNLGKRKAAMLSDSSNDYAKGMAKSFKKKFKEKGGEIVTELNYAEKDTDFNVQLTKIKDMDFDVLYIPGYYNEVGLIIKQARSLGIDVPIIGGDGFDSSDLVKLAGAENLNDVYFTTAYTTVNASDELTAFIEAYKEEYGEEPSMFSARAYDATNVMIEAYEKAGKKDMDAAKDALDSMKFNGVTGSFTFDKTHTPTKDVLVVKLVDGVQSDAVKVDPNK